VTPPRVAGVVLAAGEATRFGGGKVLAPLAGRPLLEHVLDAAIEAGLAEIVVVLGEAAPDVERVVSWRGERRVVNPEPSSGLSSSLRIGLASVGADADAAVVLLGDQPLVRAAVIRALVDRAAVSDRPIVVPRYADGSGPNPALVRRSAWGLAEAARGDRGLGPTIAAHPELVEEVPLAGGNPDVDTRSDLAALEGRPRGTVAEPG